MAMAARLPDGAAVDAASCPLQRRLFLHKEWAASDADRRALTRVPPEVTHRGKWRLTLDKLDTLDSRGMRPPAAVADAAYGTDPTCKPHCPTAQSTCWPSART